MSGLLAKKCWDCAKVNKCPKIFTSNCDEFVKYREYVTTKEIALLINTSERTLYRRLKSDDVATLQWVNTVSGFTFTRVSINDERKCFRLKVNSARNIKKLDDKLLRLKKEKESK